jgi:hypothetical protein
MSCVILITPLVVAGWPVFCGAAAAAASSLGFRMLKAAGRVKAEAQKKVEIGIENSEVLTEQVRADDEIILAKGDITIRIYKDARGKCSLHVVGEGRTDAELKQEGEALINKIKQQYAYQKVTQELKNKGFSITGEEATEEGKIRIRLRRFD